MRWRELAMTVGIALGCGRGAPEAAAAPAAAALPARIEAALAYATYWGAPGGSALRSAVFDAAGNLYIAGGTDAATQWPQTGPAAGPLGGFDVIVAKFDASGSNLWSRVIGGTTEDYAYVSALAPDGNLIVGGRAGPGFPVTPGAFATKFAGGFAVGPHGATDGFLMSLTPDGDLRWATYVGTSGDDIVRALEVLPDGSMAFAGGAQEFDDLPVTPGVVKPKMGGAKDSLLGRLAADGSHVLFLSYFGPSDDTNHKQDETLRAIALDPSGNLWLGGTTQGTDLTPTPDAFQPERSTGSSAYVAKLTPDGRRIVYFSWLGGPGGEDVETEGRADASGAFLVAGGTTSESGFPVTPGACSQGAREDGWVARVEADGKLGMAARFGGSGRDHVFGPAEDAAGNLYVGGTTDSKDLPVTTGALLPRFAGGPSDALFAAFDRTGALAYATYFGGAGAEAGRFAAADAARGRVALIGETNSTDLTLHAAAQTQPGAVFVAVFQIGAPAAPDSP
ncbi:MAG TPA: hypothetical protein VII78_17780 [Myxococcota bacterium]|jgi:hypothetical protein